MSDKCVLFFNTSKTVCMVFTPTVRSKSLRLQFPSFAVDGSDLKFVTQFKYLGHVIEDDLHDDADILRDVRELFMPCNILKCRY